LGSACLSVYLSSSIYLTICVLICMHVFRSVYLSICLSACLSVCLSVSPFALAFAGLYVCLCVCLSVCMYVTVCLSVRLSVCLSVRLSICPYFTLNGSRYIGTLQLSYCVGLSGWLRSMELNVCDVRLSFSPDWRPPVKQLERRCVCLYTCRLLASCIVYAIHRQSEAVLSYRADDLRGHWFSLRSNCSHSELATGVETKLKQSRFPILWHSFIHSFILNIYIAPLQEKYSEASISKHWTLRQLYLGYERLWVDILTA